MLGINTKKFDWPNYRQWNAAETQQNQTIFEGNHYRWLKIGDVEVWIYQMQVILIKGWWSSTNDFKGWIACKQGYIEYLVGLEGNCPL